MYDDYNSMDEGIVNIDEEEIDATEDAEERDW